MPFSYSTSYKLTKSHFLETFDESTPAKVTPKAYVKSIGFVFIGFSILYFTDLNSYLAWFIVFLGFVEACSVYFRRSWWLARQMVSQASNSELTLTINESGISSKSFIVDSKITWDEITKIEKTRQGWLFYHASGKNYISDSCLSDAAKDYIAARAEAISDA